MFNRKEKLALLFVVHRQTDFPLGLFVPKLQILTNFGRNKPENVNKDFWLLVEAIGIAIWELEFNRTHSFP